MTGIANSIRLGLAALWGSGEEKGHLINQLMNEWKTTVFVEEHKEHNHGQEQVISWCWLVIVMSRCKLVCFFHCKKLDVVVGDPNIYDKDSLHCTILFGTSLHCTESTALHRTVFKVHFTSGSTGQHNFSEAVRLSVNMRVKSHATISTWWPGHLVGGLSCLTWPAKDTSWECPPHIL